MVKMQVYMLLDECFAMQQRKALLEECLKLNNQKIKVNNQEIKDFKASKSYKWKQKLLDFKNPILLAIGKFFVKEPKVNPKLIQEKRDLIASIHDLEDTIEHLLSKVEAENLIDTLS